MVQNLCKKMFQNEEFRNMWIKMHTPWKSKIRTGTHGHKTGRNEICPYCTSGKKFKSANVMKGTKPTHLLRAEVKQIFEVWLTNEQAEELMAPEGYVKISTESKLFENLVSMDIPSVKLDGQELPDSCYLKIDNKKIHGKSDK